MGKQRRDGTGAQLPAQVLAALGSPGRSNRRGFMRDSVALGVAVGAGASLAGCGGGGNGEITTGLFRHGVASGDPLADRVIIWTRLTPAAGVDTPVRWELAGDESFAVMKAAGNLSSSWMSDHTIKVDVTGLQAGTVYYYRFLAGSETSSVGRTKTLPADGIGQVRLAVFSCSNFGAGHFHAYGEVAALRDIDCAIHLGDYIYETGSSGAEGLLQTILGREVDPDHEISTLVDYRRRHAQYRNDAKLRAVHAWMPMIAVWDDHDIVNGAWRGGAGDQDPVATGFVARRAAAIQAWREWLPVRDATDPLKLYRSFNFGKLLSLHMLDTRIIGRDQQLTPSQYLAGAGEDPARQIMGQEQASWLGAQMQASTATWQVLGQQVLMARMQIPQSIAGDFTQDKFAEYFTAQDTPAVQRSEYQQFLMAQPFVPYNLDAWDGYPKAREAVFNLARTLDKNLVVLAGDSHNAWANDLKDASGRNVGVEFAGASVSSPGFEATKLKVDSDYLAAALRRLVPDLQFAQTNRRGYLLVTFTAAEVRAEWKFVSTVLHNSYTVDLQQTLRCLPGVGGRKLLAA